MTSDVTFMFCRGSMFFLFTFKLNHNLLMDNFCPYLPIYSNHKRFYKRETHSAVFCAIQRMPSFKTPFPSVRLK